MHPAPVDDHIADAQNQSTTTSTSIDNPQLSMAKKQKCDDYLIAPLGYSIEGSVPISDRPYQPYQTHSHIKWLQRDNNQHQVTGW